MGLSFTLSVCVVFALGLVAAGLHAFALGLIGAIGCGCARIVAGGRLRWGQISHLSPDDA